MFNSSGYHEHSQTANQNIISVWDLFFPIMVTAAYTWTAFLLDDLKL